MPVRKSIESKWGDNLEQGMDKGLLEIVTDIHHRAVIIAPKDSRALVNSGIIESAEGGIRVRFGSDKVPYARSRHYENKKNPGSKGYLAKAGDSVARGEKLKYFKGKI